ncbi:MULTISPECIES: GNAT family N-acetyltransferase [unclassified Streptomyces]|uniref:GNAT family N-acetyltransferase n=1 Tax=unclassified Streptomyces TaxID=2593676 RepID=UPI001162054E|nr:MULTISPECIES: GNAT family N-acetyltransferase [unclassified Streptomyces]NMI56155.1 GNAT family N-acetyltransferase [Streptomyces sp. RLA2-12]QDN55594.1 GNAT family N-acetyltransferase [Streptomyces sp. S1D4-20]QDN65772.1 GNAT family N-acetyltransferase [Streptomyces sp. S1D4-14]QDN96412.1 GNAT family N-acetyltransferase [Streptomyces sp. RLB1-9]QDO18121.1 GNAT family N-acetyltransferase [Streptomyces sp. S1A1-8]
MDHVGVLALFDRDMREGARPDSPGARVERVDKVVRQVGTEHGWNGVIWSDLDESNADAAIAEQMRYFGELGREFEWKLYGHDKPEDLGKRLRAAGFIAQPEETLMIAELGDLALDAQPPEGVRLLPVTDRAGVDLVADVHEQAFGTDSTRMRHQLLAQLTGDEDKVVAVVALAGDVPVSAARMELVPGTRFAGLWGGGTIDSWRRRGIYRALVAHRARVAAERGYRYVQVDATSQSRPVLARLGFEPLTTTTPYVYG